MNTTINAVKFKADEKLEKFVNEKVAKLDRLIDNATKCEVNLKLDKPESDNNKIAELSLNLPGQTLFNSKQADTFEEAIAQCVDSMKGQIEKYKERYNR
jgi:putative sigma-54 modulation protein